MSSSAMAVFQTGMADLSPSYGRSARKPTGREPILTRAIPELRPVLLQGFSLEWVSLNATRLAESGTRFGTRFLRGEQPSGPARPNSADDLDRRRHHQVCWPPLGSSARGTSRFRPTKRAGARSPRSSSSSSNYAASDDRREAHDAAAGAEHQSQPQSRCFLCERMPRRGAAVASSGKRNSLLGERAKGSRPAAPAYGADDAAV
jgi:hypothetical protein